MTLAADSRLVPIIHLIASLTRRTLLCAFLGALLLPACSDRELAGESGGNLAPQSGEARERSRQIRALQAGAGPEYRAHELDPGVWSAFQPEMQLRTRFEAGLVSLVATRPNVDPVTPIELAAVAWGCQNTLQAIPATPPTLSTEHPGAIEYHHSDFDEWYLPGPAGLEQGFAIRSLPACAARGETLQIRLAQPASGPVTVSPGKNGEALLSEPGAPAIHYGEAFAEDATGKETSVQIRTDAGLMLELDASDSQLPIAIDPLAWVEQQKLSANDGSAGDFFAKAIAISDDTLLVGAYGDDDHARDSGSAYVFVRVAGAWALQQKLTASDAAVGDHFGYSVALSGDSALVGAPLADGAAIDSGAAYVFTRSGSVWSQQAKLVASDAVAGDQLATAVAISGPVALLGAPFAHSKGASEAGAAYVFSGNAGTWAQSVKLSPGTTAGDHNGTGVAISGSNLAIGSARSNGYTVSFYAFDGNSWITAGNVASNSAALAYYGSALAMSTTYTVVGNYAHPFGPSGINGTVLVLANTTHSQQATLRANDGALNDLFGSSVAISESNLILVGSPQDDDQGTDSGSAFVFGLNGTTWVQQQKLSASDGKANDGFGSAVALSASATVVGAWQGKNTSGTGHAYAASLAQTGAACTQSSECTSGFCVEGVCCASACNGACQSCLQKNKANNGGGDGVCGSVRLDTDPRNSCPDPIPGSCGPTGLCDGKGACSVTAVGTSCTYSACASGTSSTLNSACDGSGECKPTATVPCQLGYACVMGICRSGCHTDSDCDGALGFICSEAKVCKQPKGASCSNDINCSTGTCQYGHCCLANPDGACIKPLGIQCSSATECASGQCTDGVCCSSSSCGLCQSCAIAGNWGSCRPLASAPPETPGQAACAGGAGGDTGTSNESGAGGDSGAGADSGASGDPGNHAGGRGGAVANGAAGNAGSAGPSTQSGGATMQMPGAAGVGQGGSSGTGGNGVGQGAASNHGGWGGAGPLTTECSSDADCESGLACERVSHTCRDQLVTACGCRVAGERSPSSSWLAGVALAIGAGAARRKRRALTGS